MIKDGQILTNKDSHKIIYDMVKGDDNYIVFLSGLMSDRKGSKALYLKEFAKKSGYSYICFDYLGHGDSDLEFVECNINIWLENTLDIIKNLTNGKIILVGSSLGGWLMLRVAELIPERIKALVGIAAAPDFTEDLMWDGFSNEVKDLLEKGEIYNLPSDYCDGNYPITIDLIKSGRENFIVNRNKVDINLPIRLFQGMKDEDVPYEYALKIANIVSSNDIEVKLIKEGDHRLSREQDLQQICAELRKLVEI